MDWEFIKPPKVDKYFQLMEGYDWKIPLFYLPIIYFDIFNLLFKLENSLRIFVYYVLRCSFKQGWGNTQISDTDESTLTKLFKQRRSEHDKYGYLNLGSNNPMLYLTLNELFSIITKESFRQYFGKYISGSLNVWDQKFGEIKAIRNNLTHFRKVGQKDLERIKMTVEDLDESLLAVFRELFDVEAFKKYDISRPEGLLAAWDFLLGRANNSILSLETSRLDSVVKLSIETKTKVVAINQYSPVELFIDYFTIDLTRLYTFLSGILPHVIYFTHDAQIGPLKDKHDRFSGEMSLFEICLFFDINEFQKNYAGLFSIIKDMLDQIESDCSTLDKNLGNRLKILSPFCCNLREDWHHVTEPTNVPKERCIEDWSGLSFGGDSLIDFRSFPWIEETILCDPHTIK